MRLAFAIACVVFASFTSPALADPVQLKTGTTAAGWHYWELTPNLAEAELSIAASDSGALLETMLPKGTLAALNGGYFLKNYKPTGWAKDAAKEYGKPNRKSKKGGVVAVKGQQVFIGRLTDLPFQPDFVIQNSPLLIEAGGVIGIKSDDGRKAARTTACLSGKSLRFILIAAQNAQGPTLKETAELLARPVKEDGFGCDVALNLDGGPSTGAWFAPGQFKEPSPVPLVPIGYGIVIRALKL